MATATTSTPNSPPAETPAEGLRPYRMTVEEYQRVADSGALGPRSKVILWKGQLVEKVADMGKGRPHVYAVNRVGMLLSGLVAAGYFVEQDQPLAVGDDSMPEPDLKVVRGAMEDYQDRAPATSDAPLVVEVSDSSLRLDTTEMLEAYARALVPVYWVVNLPKKRIEVFSGPSGPRESPTYGEHRCYGPGEEAPVVLDGREVGRVAVSSILF